MHENLTSQIREARLRKGLTQTQLGSAVGVSKQAVSGWESGASYPDIRALAGITRTLRPHFNLTKFINAAAADVQQGRAS